MPTIKCGSSVDSSLVYRVHNLLCPNKARFQIINKFNNESFYFCGTHKNVYFRERRGGFDKIELKELE